MTNKPGVLVCDQCKRIDTSGCNAPETCGDGVVDEGEECDGEELGAESCEGLGFGPGVLACMTNCRFDTSGCGPVELCGNGEIDDGEECDDGNNMNGDGCSNTCHLETGWHCEGEPMVCDPICGDGLVLGMEECDGSVPVVFTCENMGYYPGEVACFDCRLDYSGCGGTCGDEIFQSPFEECDYSMQEQPHTCQHFGLLQGTGLFCNGFCEYDFHGCEVDADFPKSHWVKVGGNHSCAYGAWNDPLFCWGNHGFGQIGIGHRDPPALVPGPSFVLPQVHSASTGKNHTCAIRDFNGGNQRLFCWGRNNRGQLGVGFEDFSDRHSANNDAFVMLYYDVPPDPITHVEMVSAGGEHTCAVVMPDRHVYCWGDNQQGQLGLPATADAHEIPVQIHIPDPNGGGDIPLILDQVAAGNRHTCGFRFADNQVYCWGDNTFGQLGRPESSPHPVPVPFSEVGMNSIQAGDNHTCVMSTSGVFCWGSNSHGQIRPGGGIVHTPHLVSMPGGYHGAMQISAGGNSTCMTLMPGEHLFCWGQNDFGQLGLGDTNDRSSPAQVMFESGQWGVSSISISRRHACAVTVRPAPMSRRVYCWGANDTGQLGDRSRHDSTFPVMLGEFVQ